MNCSDLDLLLGNGTRPLPPRADAHLRSCRRCRALAEALERSLPLGTVSGASVDAIEQHLLSNLRTVHVLPARKLFFFAFLLIFLILLALGVGRLGAYAWADMNWARRILICTSLGASAALLAYSMVQQMFPGSRCRISPPLLPVGIFVCLTLILAGLFEVGHSGSFIRDGMPCFEAGIPYAIVAAILFWLILRRGAVLSARTTGAICGALAGLIGVSVLEIQCSNFDLRHILVWHLGVGVSGAVAGLVLGWAGETIRRKRATNVADCG